MQPESSTTIERAVYAPWHDGVKEVSKTWCLTSTETTRLISDGEIEGKGVWRWREKEIIYLTRPCHHQNDSCIKMGSDESHFNVSLIEGDKVTNKTVSTDHIFFFFFFLRNRRADADSNRGPIGQRSTCMLGTAVRV